MVKEKDSRIKTLQLELEMIKNQSQVLKAEMASKAEETLRSKRPKQENFFGL